MKMMIFFLCFEIFERLVKPMFDSLQYMNDLISMLTARFAPRLVYVGLQGSYLRGEARETSDIDPMVVIDGLTPSDLDAYRGIIGSLPHPELSCGFLCGKADLACWNPLEICHLVHTTRDFFGKLADLVPAYSVHDVRSYVKLSAGNMLHELCHRYVHGSRERNHASLPGTYKGVFFILQNVIWLEQGVFAPTKAALLPLLNEEDRHVLHTSIRLCEGEEFDFDSAYALLLAWCQQILRRMA